MSARKYLVGVIVLVLLIWGPVDHAWPAWLFIRISYLVAIPTAAWFVLGLIWKLWRPDGSTEQRLNRTLAGATAGALLVGAIVAAQTKHHFICSQEVQTRDGPECVGDYVRVPGPDVGQAVVLTLAAGFAFWIGVRRE